MKIFDSNFWIAFFDIADSQHEKAEKIMREEPFLIITEYCVVETASILAKKAGMGASSSFLEFIEGNADISILYSSQDFFKDSSTLFRSLGGKKFSFVDVSLLHLSRTYEIITFDKMLKKEIQKLK